MFFEQYYSAKKDGNRCYLLGLLSEVVVKKRKNLGILDETLCNNEKEMLESEG